MDYNLFGSDFFRVFRLYFLLICISQVCHSLREGPCLTNAVYMDEGTICSRQYRRCESNTWFRALCVNGFFNSTEKRCVPSSVNCPNIGIVDKGLVSTSRPRRQAQTGNACDHSYLCPRDISHEFIYPDWANKDCDTYYQCIQGALTLRSCNNSVYTYYNPRTLSCEENPSLTNTCLQRLKTDLSPIQS